MRLYDHWTKKIIGLIGYLHSSDMAIATFGVNNPDPDVSYSSIIYLWI